MAIARNELLAGALHGRPAAGLCKRAAGAAVLLRVLAKPIAVGPTSPETRTCETRPGSAAPLPGSANNCSSNGAAATSHSGTNAAAAGDRRRRARPRLLLNPSRGPCRGQCSCQVPHQEIPAGRGGRRSSRGGGRAASGGSGGGAAGGGPASPSRCVCGAVKLSQPVSQITVAITYHINLGHACLGYRMAPCIAFRPPIPLAQPLRGCCLGSGGSCRAASSSGGRKCTGETSWLQRNVLENRVPGSGCAAGCWAGGPLQGSAGRWAGMHCRRAVFRGCSHGGRRLQCHDSSCMRRIQLPPLLP